MPEGVLAGKYQLLEKLGQGGMGSVWKARHLTLSANVAIKLIDPEAASNPDSLQRFLREARAAAALRSPHVVQILDHGVDEGTPFIVMELLEGISLAKRLESGRLSPEQVAQLVTQVARAVGRAHEAGIVHRDLKPDNIFLVKNDDEEVAKVLDFGIVKGDIGQGSQFASATRTGVLLGTPYFMSPEQVAGSRAIDFRTDIWSLGVIVYECLLGRKPFDGQSLTGLMMAICTLPMPVPSSYGPVPPGFDAWFARACARDPNLRFVSVKQAASELSLLCGGQPVPSSAQPQAFAGTVPMSAVPMSAAPMSAAPMSAAPMSAAPPAMARLASTTGQLSHATTIPGVRRRAVWPWVAVAALGVVGTSAGAAWYLRPAPSDAATSASSSPATPAAPPATETVPPAAPPAPAPSAPAVLATPATPATASAAAPPPATRPAARRSPAPIADPAPAPIADPAPAPIADPAPPPSAPVAEPAPAPAPAAPTPTRERPNLGF